MTGFSPTDAPLASPILFPLSKRNLTQDSLTHPRPAAQLGDLQTLMEQAPVGIVVVDMDGFVVDINAAAVRILGSPGRDASLGINVLTLPRLVENDVSDMLFRQVIETGEPVEIESPYVSRWGKDVYLRAKLSPCYDTVGRQTGVIQILEDITAQKQVELDSQRQLRYVRALAQCSQTLLQTPADDEQQLQILNEALAHLVTGAQVGRVYIFRNFKDPELGNCLGIVAEACALGVEPHISTPLSQRAPWSSVPEAMHRSLRAGRPWGGPIAELWRDRPEFRDRMLRQPLLSAQFFPIFFGDHWWGFIGFDDLETVRQWDAEEITLLGTASEIFSSAMQRWRAERALQEERDELEARVQVRTAVLERRVQMERVLATAAERLMTQEDFGAAIEQTLQEVGELVDAAVTLLVRIDAPNRSILASYRWKAPDIPEMPFVSGPDEDWLRQQVHARKPIYLPDVEKDVEDEAVREGLLKREMRAIALYPLVVEGDIAGVFHVRLRQALTGNNAADTFATLDVMANLLNGLLQRQVLIENLEQRVLERTRELAAVLDIAMLDVEAVELADVVKPMLSLISELVRSQAVSVHLLTEDGAMQLVAQQGLPSSDSEPQAVLQTPAHLADWLQTEGDPILATTADALAMLPYQQANAHFDAGLAVQIGGGDRPQGILSCYRQGHGSFTLNQIALATALADYMGTIIENHLLRIRVEDAAIAEERQRLARDLHDSVSQSLYGVTLFARAGRNALVEKDWSKAESDIVKAEQNALHVIKEMRLLLYQLQPLALKQVDLAEALNQRFEQVEHRVGVQVSCYIDPTIGMTRSVEKDLYQLTSEALNNALKHADASKVEVRLEKQNGQTVLTICDDGPGFDPTNVKKGMGLDNMQHRVQRFGGQLFIESQPGQGTVVRCVLDGVGVGY